MSINFKSIKVWNKFKAAIGIHRINVLMDNLKNRYLSLYWPHHQFVFFISAICSMLPTLGQYSIDITIEYCFMCWDALEALIAYNWARLFWCSIFFKNWSCMHGVTKLFCIVLKNCGNDWLSMTVNTGSAHTKCAKTN